MDQTSYDVDQSTDRKHAAMIDAQEMADRQRECAWDDARREVQQAGIIGTDMMIEDHLSCDQQHLLSELIYHALQAAACEYGEKNEYIDRMYLAADALFEAVVGSRCNEILRDRWLA